MAVSTFQMVIWHTSELRSGPLKVTIRSSGSEREHHGHKVHPITASRTSK